MTNPLTMTQVEQQFNQLGNPPTDAGSLSMQKLDELIYMTGRSAQRLSQFVEQRAPEAVKISELGMLNRRLTALRMRSLELTHFFQRFFPREQINESRVKERLLELCLLFTRAVTRSSSR